MKNDGTLRLGYWLSLLVLLMAVVYFGTLVAAQVFDGMPPAGSYESMISIVTLLVAPCMVLLWAVIYQVTPDGKRALSFASLA